MTGSYHELPSMCRCWTNLWVGSGGGHGSGLDQSDTPPVASSPHNTRPLREGNHVLGVATGRGEIEKRRKKGIGVRHILTAHRHHESTNRVSNTQEAKSTPCRSWFWGTSCLWLQQRIYIYNVRVTMLNPYMYTQCHFCTLCMHCL